MCEDSAKTNGLHLFGLRVYCLFGIIRTVFKALDFFFISLSHVISLIYPILKVSYTRYCFTQDLILQCHRASNIQFTIACYAVFPKQRFPSSQQQYVAKEAIGVWPTSHRRLPTPTSNRQTNREKMKR